VSPHVRPADTASVEPKVAELDQAPPTEEEQVLSWRREWLERTGYCRSVAATIAARRDIDLHLAVALPQKGCPHNTAVRILL
jgi:hypothetical protein